MRADDTSIVKNIDGKPAGWGRLQGTISKWEKERGYGWVLCNEGSVFVHIREFEKGFLPREGDELTFTLGADPKGRPCLKNVRCERKEIVPIGKGVMTLLLLLLLPIVANFKLPISPWILPAVMIIISIAAWATYQYDKKCASEGRWRVSETQLHGLELLGGWPGAFLAQRKFRHKTRKVSYQAIFWAIVFLYQIVALDFILNHRLWAEAALFWTEWILPPIG